MGFEDDLDYQDNFETETADPDSADFGEKPRKLSRKELREAKKKTAEKTADLPKQKKGLFQRHQRVDDNDAALSDDHIFDPTRSPMVSTGLDHGSDFGNTPIRSTNSEFAYLFDPVDGDEREDDVYPEQSIYSDSETAKELLAGLTYDEKKDGDSEKFDQYFDEDKPVRPPSRFSFRKRKKEPEDLPDLEDIESSPEPVSPAPLPVKVTPKKAEENEKPDSYLPELRPDSVFHSQPKESTPPLNEDRYGRNDGNDRYDRNDRNDRYDDYESEGDYMSQDSDKNQQEFIPYGGMYPSYPMTPMNQMMSYPMVIPNGGQNQSQGGMPYQTIPIPYPMPMPMPMPMYSQYPSYPPQYPSYPPQYPPYPPYSSYPSYPPYDDRRYERRGGRRDERWEERRDSDRYAEEYDDRRDDRRYNRREDDRYDRRGDDRYDRRQDNRYDRRQDDRYRDSYADTRREPERRTYPEAPYEPPYPQQTAPPEPVRTEAPAPVVPEPIFTPPVSPEPIQAAPSAPIASEPNMSDFTFSPPIAASGPPEPVAPIFSNDPFSGMSSDSMQTASEDDEFGFGFGGKSVSSAVSSAAADSAAADVEEGKPKGGRFKKRH